MPSHASRPRALMLLRTLARLSLVPPMNEHFAAMLRHGFSRCARKLSGATMAARAGCRIVKARASVMSFHFALMPRAELSAFAAGFTLARSQRQE